MPVPPKYLYWLSCRWGLLWQWGHCRVHLFQPLVPLPARSCTYCVIIVNLSVDISRMLFGFRNRAHLRPLRDDERIQEIECEKQFVLVTGKQVVMGVCPLTVCFWYILYLFYLYPSVVIFRCLSVDLFCAYVRWISVSLFTRRDMYLSVGVSCLHLCDDCFVFSRWFNLLSLPQKGAGMFSLFSGGLTEPKTVPYVGNTAGSMANNAISTVSAMFSVLLVRISVHTRKNM